MIHAQNTKTVQLFLPQSVATNGTASGTVNLQNWDEAKVILQLSTASSANTDALVRISEGDTTSVFATATDTNMTTAAPNTTNGQNYIWYLDLRKRKKFLKIEYSPSASAARVAAASVELSRAEQAPITAAGRGADAQVIS